jgi:hypothetical protein
VVSCVVRGWRAARRGAWRGAWRGDLSAVAASGVWRGAWRVAAASGVVAVVRMRGVVWCVAWRAEALCAVRRVASYVYAGGLARCAAKSNG